MCDANTTFVANLLCFHSAPSNVTILPPLPIQLAISVYPIVGLFVCISLSTFNAILTSPIIIHGLVKVLVVGITLLDTFVFANQGRTMDVDHELMHV